jgi:hypothetical protein
LRPRKNGFSHDRAFSLAGVHAAQYPYPFVSPRHHATHFIDNFRRRFAQSSK